MAIKNFNTDFFLKEQHIQKAYELAKAQIEEKSNTFKTIELEIYRRDKVLKDFDSKRYHQLVRQWRRHNGNARRNRTEWHMAEIN